VNLVTGYFRELAGQTLAGWNRFWFTPADPATLGLIRILGGSMIFYTHLIWTLDLPGFFGPDGRLSREFVRSFHQTPWGPSWAWSHFDWPWAQSLGGMWTLHGLALLVMALFTLGVLTRVTSVLTFLITVSYAHRVPIALFGLDQVNAMLAMYLMIGPAGAAYSVDRWLAARRGKQPISGSVSANVAIRLMQLHMCVIYLFAGLGKLQGETWWDGTALWGALANYEYQSMDMTWLGQWPLLINVLTHTVVAWEVSYTVLIWPRLTRPIILALAVPLHLGIAFCMGMITFGLAMLIGNLAFISPWLVRQVVGRVAGRGRAGQGGVSASKAGRVSASGAGAGPPSVTAKS
jgi:hypothetical protein